MQQQHARPQARSVPPVRSEVAPRDVLVVEDESLVAMMVADGLERGGYRPCGIAHTEAEALRMAEQTQPDFAVVDLRLGNGNGLNVGRALAQRGVTVLYASAYGPSFRQEMEDSGARACLAKPFTEADVPLALDALEKLSEGRAPRRVPPGFHLFVD
jgi:CheY-like chemotaxis protein